MVDSSWALTGVIAATILGGIVFHTICYLILAQITKSTKSKFLLDSKIVKHTRWPSLPIVICIALLFIAPVVPNVSSEIRDRTRVALAILLTLACGWMAIKLLNVVEYEILHHSKQIDVENNHSERRVRTQVGVFKRLAGAFIVVITIAACIMSFDKARQLGTALLASAGVFGLIVGLATTPAIENAIAALQIAVSQPIKIGDVVIVEGEWGIIEDITSSFVVVAIWDQRRLVCPLTRFTKSPFQNWTMTTTELLGTVFMYVDYSTPLDPLREYLVGIVSKSKKWDRRVCTLAVTDLKERTMELRCLISAKNASDAFDLRCEVREKMIVYLQTYFPSSLPHVRAEPIGKLEKEKRKHSSKHSSKQRQHTAPGLHNVFMSLED